MASYGSGSGTSASRSSRRWRRLLLLGLLLALPLAPLLYLLVVEAEPAAVGHGPPQQAWLADATHPDLSAGGPALLASHATASHGLCLGGWWQEHSPWHIAAHGQPPYASSTLMVRCRPDSPRAIFQNLFVQRSRQLPTRLRLSAQFVTASQAAQCLPSQTLADGIRVVVKIIDPETAGVLAERQIRFLPSRDLAESQATLFRQADLELQGEAGETGASDSQLLQILVTVACVKCSGDVVLQDVMLQDLSRTLQPAVCPGQYLPAPVAVIEPDQVNVLRSASPGALRALANGNQAAVTLLTQLSMDRLDRLVSLASVWQGAVVAVVYMDGPLAETGWHERYIHKKLGRIEDVTDHFDCWTVVLVQATDEIYPVNQLRNVALYYAKTDWVLSLDVDFMPSSTVGADVAAAVSQLSSSGLALDRAALVVPAFEAASHLIGSHFEPPKTKEQLKVLVQQQRTVWPFRLRQSPLSHQAVQYPKWYEASAAYPIIYADKFEPYVVLKRDSAYFPQYDVAFAGYGMNKVTYAMELAAAGYNFHVLPNSWAIHMPHGESLDSQDFVQNVERRTVNRAERFRFLARLQAKYGLESCANTDAAGRSEAASKWRCD